MRQQTVLRKEWKSNNIENDILITKVTPMIKDQIYTVLVYVYDGQGLRQQKCGSAIEESTKHY